MESDPRAVDRAASLSTSASKAPGSDASAKHARWAAAAMALACGLAITSTTLCLGVMPLMQSLAGSRDFIVYWATGQQLVHHADPYDTNQLNVVEHSSGFKRKGTFYMRNPPWSLPLAAPLGFLPARVAALPWSLFLYGLLFLCVRTVWKMFGHAGTRLDMLGYCFPPALICVVMGQTSMFLLVGLVGFLRFHKSRPFWAGAALWLCTLKPHVFIPFGAALLAWIAIERQWRVLAGAAATMAASCALTEWMDPQAWGQYLHWARNSGISEEFIPCISVALRNLIDPRAAWIAFVPCALGAVWGLVYYWQRRHAWSWVENGNLLMLVSLVVAPYCWIYDQSLAMPALLYAAARVRSQALLGILAILFIGVEFQTFVVFWEYHYIFMWPGLAWLVWYWFARRPERTAVIRDDAEMAV